MQPGPIAQAGLVSPEFKITTDTTVFGAADYLHDIIYYGAAFDPYDHLLRITRTWSASPTPTCSTTSTW